MGLRERILNNTKLSENGCLEWMGQIDVKSGYGRKTIYQKNWNLHRLIWTLTNGDPGNLCVLHKCDNRKCININHLFLGTKKDNAIDMAIKMRCRNSKISVVEAGIIKEAAKKFKHKDIADYFKISRNHVSSIACGSARAYVNP